MLYYWKYKTVTEANMGSWYNGDVPKADLIMNPNSIFLYTSPSQKI